MECDSVCKEQRCHQMNISLHRELVHHSTIMVPLLNSHGGTSRCNGTLWFWHTVSRQALLNGMQQLSWQYGAGPKHD